MSRLEIPILDRLNSKTVKVKLGHMETECWEWTGALDLGGYGKIGYKGKTHRVNAISAFIHFGLELGNYQIHGLEVCHKCDNQKCWNPEHLYIGTRGTNTLDRVNKRKAVISAIDLILKELDNGKA